MLDDGHSRLELPRGRAAFLSAEERDVYVHGTAELYGTSSGIR